MPPSPRNTPKTREPKTLSTPWPHLLAALVLLQLSFNLMAALLMVFSAVALDNLGMRFGLYLLIPLIGAQFLVFPGLSFVLLKKTRILRQDEDPPGFWYLMILGFGLIIWLFPSVPQSLDAWRLWQSHEARAESVAEVLRYGDSPVVLDLPGFQMLTQPLGRYIRRSRSDDGRVTTTSYTVVPLVPAEGEADPRLWLGWENMLADSAQAGYFRVQPWNTPTYHLAVENALGSLPSGALMILERTPDLATAQANTWRWLKLSFILANAATLGALLAIVIGIGIHRLRQRNTSVTKA